MLYIVLHEALYMATLGHKECWVSVCAVTLHNLCGHLQKDKLVHRSADDLHVHMLVRQGPSRYTSWLGLSQAVHHYSLGMAASGTSDVSRA